MSQQPEFPAKTTRPMLPWGWRSLWQHSTRTGLAALALSGSFPTASILHAQSLPTGEQTIQGSATYTPTSNSLTINTPGRAVISWGSFNIGNGNVVDFQNGGAVLNYVRQGGGASQINGMLRATNPIILLNNQGISVGRTGMISVPSILLSTGSLLPDSIDKFMQGVNYAPGLNAPLISIQLNDSSGPISVDGSISSTNGGGIGLIAPSLSIGPNARLTSLGVRTASTGTDGVNTTVNGVVPEGSLWIGTTGLPASSFTQPIPGMPGAALPTLPTGFGFTQVSGRPSPQNIRLSLQATYDFERVVIGTSGAKRGQFDALFFSPSFRASAFYLYDGIEAIEEGHRQATTGGLRRTLKDTQTNQLIDDQLESTLLGLQLPPGATLLAADQVVLDPNGQLLSGSLKIEPPSTLSQEFISKFGNGPLKITVIGGQATLEGSNGTKANYDLPTGTVTWRVTTTIPGHDTTTTQIVLGQPIEQGSANRPDGIPYGTGTPGRYLLRPEQPGTQGHSHQECHTNNNGCKGYRPAQYGTTLSWHGHFERDSSGRQVFVPDTNAQAATHVVYEVEGRYYFTTPDRFNPSTSPTAPPSQPITPSFTQTVTIPGALQEQTQTFTQNLPISGKAQAPSGPAQSSWIRPTPPVQPDLTPTPKVSPTPTPLPYNIPTPSVAPPSPGPTPAPTPTTAVVSPVNAPSWSGSNPTVTTSKGPGISGYAPYVVPNPTPSPRPVPVPTPTTTVVSPNVSPTISGYAPGPQVGKGPDVTGNAPYVVPNPTPSPRPIPVPTPTTTVVSPNVSPTISGYAPGPQVIKGPDVTGNAPYVVPNPTPSPRPIPVPTPTTTVVSPNVSPTISGYAPGPQVIKGPDVTGNAPYVVPNPTPSPRPIPVPTPTTTVVSPNVSPTISGYAPGPQVIKGPDVTGNAPYVVPNPTPSPRPIPVPTPTTTVVSPNVSPTISGYAPGPQVIKGPDVTGNAPYVVPNPTPSPRPIPVPTPTTTVVSPNVSPTISGYAPGPQVGKGPDVTGNAPYVVPNPTPSPRPIPVPTPTTTVVSPNVSPTISGYAPGPQVIKGPDVTGNAPYVVPNPTPSPRPIPVPTPTTTVVTPNVSPTISGYAPGPQVGKGPDVTGNAPYVVPNPTPSPRPVPVPTPTTTVVTPNVSPTITGYGPVNPTVNPTGAVPKPNPVPTPTAKTPVAGSDGSRAVLQPAVSRAVTSIATSGNRSERRGLAVTYEVPRALIEANVKGGLPDQSRATLPNGSQLPAALEYDPASQTFTIKDTNLLPLPLDVLLTMPTVSGGRGTFILTIGQP